MFGYCRFLKNSLKKGREIFMGETARAEVIEECVAEVVRRNLGQNLSQISYCCGMCVYGGGDKDETEISPMRCLAKELGRWDI